MKNIVFVAIALLSIFSCKQNGNKGIIEKNAESTTTEPQKFIIDSVKVEDSIAVGKTLRLHTSSEVLVFQNITNKTLLDSIYSKANIKLDNYSKENLQKELSIQKENYFSQGKKDAKEYMPDFEQTWEKNSDMNVVSNQNDILTLSYSNNGFSGGAHGYQNVFYKNFDLKSGKVIQLSDIFIDLNKVDWNKNLIENFNKLDFGMGEKSNSGLLFENKIPVNNNFFFDGKNITFTYNQYEIAPYAAGIIQIPIPFSELKPYLKPEFIKRMNIK